MEDREDVIGIAAPIFDVTGKVLYAVSIVGPSYRFTLDKARQFASLLIITAMEISEKLGYFKNE
jgi:IclR family transcriptional regulator, KDG regulon repressor